MVKILDRACTALAVIAAALFLFCTFSICYSILTRSMRITGAIWVVQFNEYAMLWITFLGTAYLLMRNKHASIQILTGRLGEKGKRLFGLAHNLLGMVLCLGLSYFCFSSTWEHILRNVIDVQAVDVPKGYVLMVIPIGFLLLSLQFLRRLVGGLKGVQAGRP